MQLPSYDTGQQYFISPEGLQRMMSTPQDPKYPGRHVLWTDDVTVELPIRMGTSGITSVTPTTLIEEFRRSVEKYGLRSALSSKINGMWVRTRLLSSLTTIDNITKNVLNSPRVY